MSASGVSLFSGLAMVAPATVNQGIEMYHPDVQHGREPNKLDLLGLRPYTGNLL